MKLASYTLAVVAALCLVAPAIAQSPQSPIHIEKAWARSTPPGAKTAAAYLTVINTGSADDRLIGASTPVAGEADVHRSFMDNGVMKMRPAGALDVKPNTPLVLSPGGLHVMMMDLKASLNDGQNFPLTLVFEKAGKVEVSVHVQRTPPAGAAGSMGNMGNMSGGHMGGMSMPAH